MSCLKCHHNACRCSLFRHNQPDLHLPLARQSPSRNPMLCDGGLRASALCCCSFSHLTAMLWLKPYWNERVPQYLAELSACTSAYCSGGWLTVRHVLGIIGVNGCHGMQGVTRKQPEADTITVRTMSAKRAFIHTHAIFEYDGEFANRLHRWSYHH